MAANNKLTNYLKLHGYKARGVLGIRTYMRASITKDQLQTAQKELAASTSILDSIQDHLVITDQDATILYANRGVEQNTGYATHEVIGKNPGDLWGRQMPSVFYEKMWHHMKTEKKPFVGEVKNRRKDGAVYWSEIRITPILDERNEVKWFLGIEPNITFRKRNEEGLLASLGDGVVAIDRYWKITYVNPAASRISGFTPQEALGKPLRGIIKFIRENDRTENIQFIEDAMVMGEVRSLKDHTVLITKDGNEVPISDTAAPVFDPEGGVIGAVIVFRDASSERMALQLRSDFAYASHQLRTPVNQALWTLENALSEKEPEKLYTALRVAYSSLRGTQKLVNQLIVVSELDQGSIMPKRETVKPADIFDEILNGIRQEAHTRNITISVAPISSEFRIDTDVKLFKRILEEILENAVYYSAPNGEVAVNITQQENGFLIEIKDTGIGIPQDQQALVFIRFFRGRNFDTNQIVGVGLGLHIAREYTKLLGGKIWFKSEEKKGTTFSIFLPEKSSR